MEIIKIVRLLKKNIITCHNVLLFFHIVTIHDKVIGYNAATLYFQSITLSTIFTNSYS